MPALAGRLWVALLLERGARCGGWQLLARSRLGSRPRVGSGRGKCALTCAPLHVTGRLSNSRPSCHLDWPRPLWRSSGRAGSRCALCRSEASPTLPSHGDALISRGGAHPRVDGAHDAVRRTDRGALVAARLRARQEGRVGAPRLLADAGRHRPPGDPVDRAARRRPIPAGRDRPDRRLGCIGRCPLRQRERLGLVGQDFRRSGPRPPRGSPSVMVITRFVMPLHSLLRRTPGRRSPTSRDPAATRTAAAPRGTRRRCRGQRGTR